MNVLCFIYCVFRLKFHHDNFFLLMLVVQTIEHFLNVIVPMTMIIRSCLLPLSSAISLMQLKSVCPEEENLMIPDRKMWRSSFEEKVFFRCIGKLKQSHLCVRPYFLVCCRRTSFSFLGDQQSQLVYVSVFRF